MMARAEILRRKAADLMPRKWGSVGLVTLATWAGLVVGCGDPETNIPVGPSGPGVAGVSIVGPDTIAPGESAQFIARIRLADGTTKAAAPATDVRWTIASPIAQIDSNGLATALSQSGETTVAAEIPVPGGVRRSTKELIIVPTGTFRLVGHVFDAEFPTAALPGARAELLPAGPAANTFSGGRFVLYGVPAISQLRISRPGYSELIADLALTEHTARSFHLQAVGPRPAFTGSQTVSIDVTGSCFSLPPELQHRRYNAVVTQTGIDLDIQLEGSQFRLNGIGRGNRFTGRIFGPTVTFQLEGYDPYYYPYFGAMGYPNVADRLADGSVLVVEGQVSTVASGAAWSGMMNSGLIVRWDVRFPNNPSALGQCTTASLIQFSLEPR
jgi:hypothetical protein